MLVIAVDRGMVFTFFHWLGSQQHVLVVTILRGPRVGTGVNTAETVC